MSIPLSWEKWSQTQYSFSHKCPSQAKGSGKQASLYSCHSFNPSDYRPLYSCLASNGLHFEAEFFQAWAWQSFFALSTRSSWFWSLISWWSCLIKQIRRRWRAKSLLNHLKALHFEISFFPLFHLLSHRPSRDQRVACIASVVVFVDFLRWFLRLPSFLISPAQLFS